MLIKNNTKGFTLIETLLYLALFTLIIGGGMAAAYQIIQSTEATHQKVIIQEEADFLLRKLEWALSGATVGNVSFTATTLTVTISGVPVTFSWDGNDNITLDSALLNSSFVKVKPVAGVMFNMPSSERVDITFTVNEQPFNETIYLH